MPTTRPRHIITETDEIAAALDRAAERWPEDRGSRKRLLLHLLGEGERALAAEREAQTRHRLRLIAVERTAGALTGTYPPGYLRDLRGDWPE